MKDEEVERILQSKARTAQAVDPALVKRIAGSITASTTPERPLPAAPVLTAALLLIGAIVALAGAARTGFYGIARFDLWARMLIVVTLTLLAGMVGTRLVGEFIPGSRRRLSPGGIVAAVVLALLVVFGFVYRDPHADHFFSTGLGCLGTGVLHALPVALIGCLLLRRGYAVEPVTAGLLMGLFGGLAGLAMLELHCPDFQASHVLVWHTAVVPLSGCIGAALAWGLHRGGLR